MASSVIGSINPYDCNVESWTAYEERMEQYFIVNGIKNNKKVAGLLTLIGDRTYGLLRSLTVPEKPSDKTYEELCDMLRTHLSPKPIVIAERFRFHKRNQGTCENVQVYIAELRKLTEYCNFGANLNDTLRDRFVCGLKDGTTQKKLLSVADLTLKKAVEIATAMEAATRDAAELQSSATETSVHAIQKRHQPQHKNRHIEKKQTTPCAHCGRVNHASNDCKLKYAMCHHCKIKGHIAAVCKKKKMHTRQNDNVNTIQRDNKKKILINPVIDGKSIKMELDTGSAVSLISLTDFTRHFGKVKLDTPMSTLKTYSGETIKQSGTKYVMVKCNGQTKSLQLCVVKKNGPTLFGRDWLSEIKLDWDSIMSVNVIDKGKARQRLQSVLQRHKSVFEDGIGKVKGLTAKLTLKEHVKPKFMKARSVPYSMKPKIEKELQTLEEQGIITKVDISDWATPIVPVVKPNGSVRICGDFKVTVNQALDIDRYPLPRIEDIFANLSNGQKYSKIDLRQAYLQLECDDNSKDLLTINTHKGLFRYNRLLYGVASAPAIWQRTMDQILQGIPGVQCMLDDMVITGDNDQTHLDTLDKVLSRLSEYGILVNKDKCLFFQDRITFCGHEIDKNGLWKTNDKIEAVLNTPRPHDVRSVRAYLGVLNYYHRFLPNLATVVKPLNQLLEKNRKFDWSDKCETAFKKSKHLITSEPVLTHYNPDLPVRLASDASPYGISGILSHVMPDGSEKPIAFASRSLTKTEEKYAQVDRESLGIYWSVKKFYPYLYGRKFTLITDCQPLTSIFSPSKSIPVTAAARIQRYAIYLSGFDYDIEYKSTKHHTNVDGLSRLPLPGKSENDKTEDVFFTSQIEHLPVTSAEISRQTRREPVLSRVFTHVQKGWHSNDNDPLLKGYFTRRNELSIHRNCLMWGIRVVIPVKFRTRVLDLLHTTHSGIVRMKSLARSYFWWPGVDRDIESLVKKCTDCQMQQKEPAKVNLHPWEWPSAPWERVHVDFAGPIFGRMFFIMVCAHSKWPEIISMKSTTAERTVQVMRDVFSRNGLCQQIVSDNGPQFTSDIFAKFMKDNGILHIRSAPNCPSSNGQAERFVQSFKSSMRAMNAQTGDLNLKLNNFLLSYRNTPHSVTGETPAKLLIGRALRCKLDLMKPDTQKCVNDSRMKMSMSDESKFRKFEIGDSVLARDYRDRQHKWKTGTVHARTGTLMYQIDIGNGTLWKRHVNQLRGTETKAAGSQEPPVDLPLYLEPVCEMPNYPLSPVVVNETLIGDSTPRPNGDRSDTQLTPERRYPRRVGTAPERLSL